jgi:sugar-specific transcriptional regulator TrmB
MSSEPPADPWSVAVEQLQEFGLSAYAARTFVALSTLGTGTARDVSRVASVPRTRVYDAVEELQEMGLASVHQSSPRTFVVPAMETVSRTFENEFQRRIGLLGTALRALDTESPPVGGVRTVEGQSAVTDRVLSLLGEADEEVVYATAEDLLTPAVIEAVAAADDRGVSVTVGGASATVRERVRTAVPDAAVDASAWDIADTALGRVLVVDGERTLLSARDDGTETAVWSDAASRGFAAVLRAMVTGRRNTE